MRGPAVDTMLERALLTMARHAGCSARVTNSAWTRWESATFSGARHRIVLACDDPAFAAWLEGLGEAEFALRGHLVADLSVDSMLCDGGQYLATITALTLIEG